MDSAHPCMSSSPILRSVGMSANIASTVQNEVKHLFKVSSVPVFHNEMIRKSHDSSDNSDLSDTYSSDLDHGSVDSSHCSPCSHILPVEEDGIVSAVVLSRWDDIMGPRTVHVWLPEALHERGSNLLKSKATVYNSPSSVKNACQFTCSHPMPHVINVPLLMKAIKYVTSHTVNYTCVTGAATPENGSSAIFIVPDLDMVAQSLMFHVPMDASSPYSLAILFKYSSYEHYLPLRSLCEHWLERLTSRLADFLLSVSGVEAIDGRELPQSTMMDNWFLEMCNVFLSVRVSGLGETSAFQSYLTPVVLGHPILERGLTSHLQTGGCTIVMGSNSKDVNSVISFLALFLDEEARCCSRLARSGQKDVFQTGLFLQGLLLDEFGCRELSSDELIDNPLPVTWIDLSRGLSVAVRQGLPLHIHQSKSIQMQNFMRIVKEDSSMVRSLLRDLRQLPTHQWLPIITMFLQQLHKLTQSLLNIIHWNGVPPNPSKHTSGVDNPTIRHLCATLHIDYPTFLIVLSLGDKMKPGSYELVMNGTPNMLKL